MPLSILADTSLKMTNKITFVFILTATCILTSCSSSININDYVEKNSPFILTLNKTDLATGLTKSSKTNIPVNSDKHLNLINWFDKHRNGWQPMPASYVTYISVTQGAFRLLYDNHGDGVIIGFIDKDKKARQYSKTIEKGELDFLISY